MMTDHTDEEGQATHKVRIWDLPTRLFHWLLTLGVLAAYITGEFSTEMNDFTKERHMTVGFVIFGLMIFRLIWGFIGSQTSRFNDFIKSPMNAIKHAKALRKREPTNEVGHNALGGYVVILFFVFILLQTISGMMSNDDVAAQGPLARFVSNSTQDQATSTHNQAFDYIVALVVLHILAIGFYTFWKRDNLVRPMISGVKEVPKSIQEKPIKSATLGLIILAVLWGLIFAGVDYLGPPPMPFDF